MRYLPTTEQDRQAMLETIGLSSVEELFASIPPEIRFTRRFQIPEAQNEWQLRKQMNQLAGQNQTTDQLVSFLGAGVYEHHIPSVVQHVISRSEFYTAYTPYQPEISQGELQAIFEFQTMIAELTGMDVANSSMYDGVTALAEAAGMAMTVTKRKKVLFSSALHPEAKEVLKTYAHGIGLQLIELPTNEDVTDLTAFEEAVDQETAAVILSYPNFLGYLESLSVFAEVIHAHKGLLIVSANPLSLGLLKPPGAMGADVVVGEAQPLGIPMAYGGPHCGFFATTKKWMRRMPGRIVGQTVDEEGKRGFVLTLQAREQHIRRDKATSNICSNQALNALAAAVYLTALGKQGLRQVAKLNYDKAHYAWRRLTAIQGVESVTHQPFFNEFVLQLPCPVAKIEAALLDRHILPGFDLGKIDSARERQLLVAVTEVRTREEIEQFAAELEAIL